MTTDELIRKVAGLGVAMNAEGNRLRLQPKSAIPSDLVPHLQAHKEEILARLHRHSWPPESWSAEQRFKLPYARLLPFVGGSVLTDLGPGRLLLVFPERAAVLLQCSTLATAWLLPEDIWPPGSSRHAWNDIVRESN